MFFTKIFISGLNTGMMDAKKIISDARPGDHDNDNKSSTPPLTPNLIPFVTADGSMSYRNISVDEMYHTKSGALQESFEKHARPLKVWEKDNPVIYDICFGLGYNAAAAIDVIREHGNDSRITVFCFENDPDILRKILEIDADFACFGLIKVFIEKFLEKYDAHEYRLNDDLRHELNAHPFSQYFQEENIEFIMLFGDARIEILSAFSDADFVFFDPFSPTHHPEMWDLKFIKDVYDKMNTGGKLSTYSYARRVRESFSAAGFRVISGPIIGRISPSTIAIKD